MTRSIEKERIERLGVYIEPYLIDAVRRTAKEDGYSVSSWVRKHLIELLKERGKVTDAALISLLSG